MVEVRGNIHDITYIKHVIFFSRTFPCCVHSQVRTLVRDEMTENLSTYDALLTPTAPTVAYKLGEKTSDPLAMYKVLSIFMSLAPLAA